MITKSKKKKNDSWKTIFYSVILGILALSMIAFLVISNVKINQKRADMIEKIENLKKEIQALEEKNKELNSGIEQSQDQTFLEEKAREQGYGLEGEQAVVVLPQKEENAQNSEKPKGIWQKFLDNFNF